MAAGRLPLPSQANPQKSLWKANCNSPNPRKLLGRSLFPTASCRLSCLALARKSDRGHVMGCVDENGPSEKKRDGAPASGLCRRSVPEGHWDRWNCPDQPPATKLPLSPLPVTVAQPDSVSSPLIPQPCSSSRSPPTLPSFGTSQRQSCPF